MTTSAEMPVDLWISEYVANLWVTECQGTTRYIRADLHAAEIAELDRLWQKVGAEQAAEIERLRAELAEAVPEPTLPHLDIPDFLKRGDKS